MDNVPLPKKKRRPKKKKKLLNPEILDPKPEPSPPRTFWYTAGLERHKKRTQQLNQENPTSDSAKLQLWFSGLTPEQRRSVFSIVDPDLAYGLLCMHEKKRSEKEGYFFEVGLHDIFKPLTVPTRNIKTYRKKITPVRGIKPAGRGAKKEKPTALYGPCTDDYFMTKDFSLRSTTSLQDENFCFTKFPFLNSDFVQSDLREADRMLEKQIRVCDTKEYMDTVTLNMRLLKDPDLFFYIMNIASRGNFLKSPCKVCYQPEKKKWKWETPSWFEDMGFYTFATFIEQRLETHLWMCYWQAHSIDPRRVKSGPDYKYTSNLLQGLSSKEHLVQFWSSLNPSKRREVTGNIGGIINDVLMESRDIQSFSYLKLLSILLLLGVTNDLHAQRSQRLNSTKTKSLSLTLANPKKDEEWIDFLFFSPLGRVDTHMDIIIRRIGVYVQTAYADKSSTDLILGEDADQKRTQTKSRAQSSNALSSSVKKGISIQPKSKETPKPEAPKVKEPAPTSPKSETKKNQDPPPLITAPKQEPQKNPPPKNVRGLAKSDASSRSTGRFSQTQPTIKKDPPPLERERKSVDSITSFLKPREKPEPPADKPALLEFPVKKPEKLSPSESSPIKGSCKKDPAPPSKQQSSGLLPKKLSCETISKSSLSERAEVPLRRTESAPQKNPPKGANKASPEPKKEPTVQLKPEPIHDPRGNLGMSQSKNPVPTKNHFETNSIFGKSNQMRNDQSGKKKRGSSSKSQPSSPKPISKEIRRQRRGSMDKPTGVATALFKETPNEWPSFYGVEVPTEGWPKLPQAGSRPVVIVKEEIEILDCQSSVPFDSDALLDEFYPSNHSTSEAFSDEDSSDLRDFIRIRSSSSPIPLPPETVVHTEPPVPSTSRRIRRSGSEDRRHNKRLKSPSLSPIGSPTEKESYFGRSYKDAMLNRSLDSVEQPEKRFTSSSGIANAFRPILRRTKSAERFKEEKPDQNPKEEKNSGGDLWKSQPGTARSLFRQRRNTVSDPQEGLLNVSVELPLSRRDHRDSEKQHKSPRVHNSPRNHQESNRETEKKDKEQRTPRFFSTDVRGKQSKRHSSSSPPPGKRGSSKTEKKKRARSISPSRDGSITGPFHSEIKVINGEQSVNLIHHLMGVDTLFAEKLHREILEFQKQSDRIVSARKPEHDEITKKVSQLVTSLWPKAYVAPYGSTAINLSTPSSDLDLMIELDIEDSEVTSRLRRLSILLQKTGGWSSIRFLETASVPVIKLITESNLHVDITLPTKKGQHSGTKASTLIQGFLDEYPEIRPMALVLKYFLYKHALNNPYTGGIGSYCLLFLIITFFQLYSRREHIPDSLETETSEERTGEEKIPRHANLGRLLMEFFELYGTRFEFEQIVINILDGGSHRLLPHRGTSHMMPLLILDPFNAQNNIGHSTFMMWKVKKEMAAVYAKPQEFISGLLEHMLREESKRRENQFEDIERSC